MIAPEAGLSASRQCALLGIARSSFYYRPRPESAEALELLKRLDRMFTDNPVYGSRRLQVALLREGISAGRRRVRRLMRKPGLWALPAQPIALRLCAPGSARQGQCRGNARHVCADRGAAGEQAPAGASRRPVERVGERRRETDSLLRVQRARRLVKIILRGGLGAVNARAPIRQR